MVSEAQPGHSRSETRPITRSGPIYELDSILIDHTGVNIEEIIGCPEVFTDAIEGMRERMLSGRAIAKVEVPQITDTAIAAALMVDGKLPEFIDPSINLDEDIIADNALSIIARLGAIPVEDYDSEDFEFTRGAEQQQLVDLMAADGSEVFREEVIENGEEYIEFSRNTKLPGISVSVGFEKDTFGKPSWMNVVLSGKPRIAYYKLNLSAEAYAATFPTQPEPQAKAT